MNRLVTLLLLTTCATLASATEFECRANGEVRIISVEYEHKGWAVPCRVRYEKPAQNVTEYPWRADATPGFCEDRTEFLANKLETLGWQCTEKPDVL